MKLLLTRPQGRNQSMAESLKQREIPFLVTPLLVVSSLYSPAQNALIANADIIIFISTNAVKFLPKLDAECQARCKIFAVGDATQQALASQGINAIGTPPDNQQTEGLLALDELQTQVVQGKQVVIVRGVGGRETLAQELTQRGANVGYCEVYQRQCPEYDKLATVAAWQQFGIDTIVLTSGEALTNLISLCSEENFSWLQACHIIVPSIRVQQQANDAKLLRVTNAGAANDAAILSALSL